MSHFGDLVKACCIVAAAATAPATYVAAHEQGQNVFTPEILYLWRETQNATLASGDDAGDLKVGKEDSARLGFGFRGTADWGFGGEEGMVVNGDFLQLSGFFVWAHDDNESSKRYEGESNPPFPNTPTGRFEFTREGSFVDEGVFEQCDVAQVDYESVLSGAELNYVMPWGDNMCLLMGPRFVALNEDLRLKARAVQTFLSDENNGKLKLRVENWMIGLQFGACGMWEIRDRLHMHFNAKAAPLFNFSSRNIWVDGGDGADVYRHNDCTTKFAAVVEGNMSLNYELTNSVEIFFGGTVIWLPVGVAQAPDNLPKSNRRSEFEHGPRGCSVVYAGAHSGLAINF